MFSIGDYVFNQKTGEIGEVIGFGHQILDSGYTTTLKVLVAHPEDSARKIVIAEDLYSAWSMWSKT
ncbi:MAG TPA: hypothetical protein DCY88_04925 [Cyanobacteria bacterium UBA11372]|nr:hypothetical protein [Cyanobacteria bacterium UBA11372]HBE52665.1 hypothetical protein [Cyanobacteria bacterium UBA11369]